jgi:hypothetical protein
MFRKRLMQKIGGLQYLEDLRHYWSFDETLGTFVEDTITGANIILSSGGSATWTRNVAGINSVCAQGGATSLWSRSMQGFDWNAPLTFKFWTTQVSSNYQIRTSIGGGSTGGQQRGFRVGLDTNTLTLMVGNSNNFSGGRKVYAATHNLGLTQGDFHFVAISIQDVNTVSCWVNGQPYTLTLSSGSAASYDGNVDEFHGEFFSSKADEMMCWGKIFSDSEVLDIYNTELAGNKLL